MREQPRPKPRKSALGTRLMREAALDGRHLSAGDIWLLQLPFTSQSTTSSTSPSLAPSDPLILAHAQNTPLSSDTSPPTPMPTSTPSSLAQWNNLPSYYKPSLLPVLKPSKYMPCLSLVPSATLVDP